MKPVAALRHDSLPRARSAWTPFFVSTRRRQRGVGLNNLQAWSGSLQCTNPFAVLAGGKSYSLIDCDFFSATAS